MKQTFTERAPEARTCLEGVPGWDGVLYWCPADLPADRPLRFWRRIHNHHGTGRDVIYQLKTYTILPSSEKKALARGLRARPQEVINFKFKGVLRNLSVSKLTMHCKLGFTVADPHHWVVDHINGDSLNNCPSNLQLISQSENVRRSTFCRMAMRRNVQKAAQALAAKRAREAARRALDAARAARLGQEGGAP